MQSLHAPQWLIAGSSIGISKAVNRETLRKGLYLAAKLDTRLVIEQGVEARELECAVLGRSSIRVSKVGEISFDSDWYDYETKYSIGTSKSIIPAFSPGPHITIFDLVGNFFNHFLEDL